MNIVECGFKERDNVLSIDQILAISWDRAVADAKGAFSFVDDALNWAVENRRITVQPLGTHVETYDGRRYDIEQFSFPMCWSSKDELRNPTEDDRIDLVAGLIDNAIQAHDDVLLRYLERLEKIVVSDSYNYQLGPLVERQTLDDDARVYTIYYRMVYTALARIPERTAE